MNIPRILMAAALTVACSTVYGDKGLQQPSLPSIAEDLKASLSDIQLDSNAPRELAAEDAAEPVDIYENRVVNQPAVSSGKTRNLQSILNNVESRLSGDKDGDGYSVADGDCDDRDPDTYPMAMEFKDGIDNNCDGLIDNELAVR